MELIIAVVAWDVSGWGNLPEINASGGITLEKLNLPLATLGKRY